MTDKHQEHHIISLNTGNTGQRSSTLILYYSNSGTTQAAAEKIHQLIGGDILAMLISPQYPNDYDTLGAFAKQQLDDDGSPTITNLPDMSKYTRVFVGFPTWFHRPPMFIDSFFEAASLNGKEIIPFTTSATSFISESTPFIEKMAAGSGAELQVGFRANSAVEITNYLKQHDLIK